MSIEGGGYPMHSLADALESFNRKERNLLVRAMLAEGGLEAGLLRAGFAGFAAAPLPSSHSTVGDV